MPRIKSDMRCENHPEFDPYNNLQWSDSDEYRKCATCRDLHHGAERAGHFNGERIAGKIDIDTAETRIGPLNLAQFGHVRYSLGWDFHFGSGGRWYVDEENMTIYLEYTLKDKTRLDEFINNLHCPLHFRRWLKAKTPKKRT